MKEPLSADLLADAQDMFTRLLRGDPGGKNLVSYGLELFTKAAHAVGSFGRQDLWREIAMRGRSESVDEFGYDALLADRLMPILEFLYRSYFRVDALWLDRIPSTGRALLVANHSGALPYDGAMLMCATRLDHPAGRIMRPLVEDFVFHFPYMGVIMNRLGGVRACQENAQRLLEQDELVAVFPEGVKGLGKLYRERYRLQRFGRGGFIKLALRTRAPIIPTAIVGAEEIHPMVGRFTWLAKNLGLPYVPITPTFPWLGPLGLVPIPTKWRIAFGEPIDLAKNYGPEAADDRLLVSRLVDQIREKVQAMMDDLLVARRSVFFG